MRFNLDKIPKEKLDAKPTVGDIFAAKGGRGDTAAWVVAAVRGDTLHMLGVDKDGYIVSTTSYGIHTMENRTCIGHCDKLAEQYFPVSA